MDHITNDFKHTRLNILIVFTLCLCVSFGSLPTLHAQACCEAYNLRVENATDLGANSFRLYLDVADDAACIDLGYSMIIQGEPADITLAEDGEYALEINGNTLTWNTCCNAGESNYLGAITLNSGEASYLANTLYLDDASQQWLGCEEELQMFTAITHGKLCGIKYNDKNCSGYRDPDEPGISGWTITIRNVANNVEYTTTTDSQGRFCFSDLTFAEWVVFEHQKTDWAQTAPSTGGYFVEISSGQTLNSLEFGNIQHQCSEVEKQKFFVGLRDNFGGTHDSPPYLSPELSSFLSGKSLIGIDEVPFNAFFAHSFVGIKPDECCIVGGTLTMRLKANSSFQADNDRLNFLEDGRGIWSAKIGDLANTDPWLEPDVATITLDLANLPGNTIKSVLPALQDGVFDLFLQDDTVVDWVELELEYCCKSTCCDYLTPVIKNNPDKGECCFDISIDVTDGMPCDISQVRMIVYDVQFGTDWLDDVTYAGSGGDSYTITDNVINVVKYLDPGMNSLGTYCLNGTFDRYNIVFEYYDFDLKMWTTCSQAVEVYCQIENGNICGSKYEDLNCNGIRDIGEPGIAGWTINIENPQNQIQHSQVTDSDGNYCFSNLKYSEWTVSEEQGNGWVQTAPQSSSYNLKLYSQQTVYSVDFGNTQVCADTEIRKFEAGVKDDFASGGEFTGIWTGHELNNYLNGLPTVGFDVPAEEQYFGHSFTGITFDNCCIVAAKLTFRAKGNGSASAANDRIEFIEDGRIIWSAKLGDLVGTTDWGVAGPVTFTLNLWDLPGSLVTSVIPNLRDGTFDMVIQNDTQVDWVDLQVYYCCSSTCCNYFTPKVNNNADQDVCCFDFSVDMAAVIGCEYSAVRMTVYPDLNDWISIDYTGDGSHAWLIEYNQILIEGDLGVGLNSLGTFCFHSISSSFRVVFEYYNETTGLWTLCNQEVTAYCRIDEADICGHKFEDLNRNGVRDPGEPGVAGFTINALNLDNNQMFSVVTDMYGNFVFNGLTYATWRIFETQRSDYVQYSPASSYYDIVLQANQAYECLNFGNAATCDDLQYFTWRNGERDDFDPDPDLKPAAPSVELQTFLAGKSPIVGFDNEEIDRYFAHTQTGLDFYKTSGYCFIGATLTLQVRTNPDLESFDDKIAFVQDGKVIYERYIGSLVGALWVGQGPTVITIDLADLDPLSTGLYGATSAMPSMLDGNFDFYIENATSVDWVEFEIQHCCIGLPKSAESIGPSVLQSSLLTPNPAQNNLKLEFSLLQAGSLQLDVVNMMGQSLISLEPQNYSVGSHAIDFNVRGLGQGAYFVRVRSESGWMQSLPFTIVR